MSDLATLSGFRSAVSTTASRYLLIAGLALLAAFIALPAVASRGALQDLIFVFYMLALAQCWNLLAGYAGLVSVGQQAFVGLGGYMLFALTLLLNIDAKQPHIPIAFQVKRDEN